MKTVTIATRKSPLALWQAEYVKQLLEFHHKDVKVELLGMTTEGDIHLDTPLAKIGGKGLFVKELEKALLEKRADIAVHSIKDLPAAFPSGLQLTTICKRDDPRDAFVSTHHQSLATLPEGATVGTSSLRRQALLKAIRPDINIISLRGNVQTRLKKLDDNEFDAIILAAAGLKRLNLTGRITQYLDTEAFIPAVGQGAVGIETRSDDHEIKNLLNPLDDPESRICVSAERSFTIELNGGCQVPIAIHAKLFGDSINLSGMVGEPDGSLQIRSAMCDTVDNAQKLGVKLARHLLDHGANTILKNVYNNYGETTNEE